MHSVLFVGRISLSDVDFEPKGGWTNFEANVVEKIHPSEYVARLARNIWLIDLTVEIRSLAHLITLAETNQVPYKILPFDEKPQWLPDQNVPKQEEQKND
jgi:hypothetical protein